MDCSPPGSSVHGILQAIILEWVAISLLQGIFPTQRLNLDLLPCRQILYPLSHQGSPRILEWVAYPFSRGSSQSRNQTEVSCIAGGFFTAESPGKPGFPGVSAGKESASNSGDLDSIPGLEQSPGSDSLRPPWTVAHQAPLFMEFSTQESWTGSRRRQWHSTAVLLPGKSHRRRSLVGCSLWGRTESDTNEVT